MAFSKSYKNMHEYASDFVIKDICQPCAVTGGSNSADMFCVDCQEYLCTSCTASHKTFKQLRGHVLITLGEMSKNPTVKKDKCSTKCPVHKDKTVKYFCGTHSVLGCSVCANIEHKMCTDFHYIPTIAASLETDNEFKQFSENLNILDTAAKALMSAIESKIAQSKIESEQIQKAIQRVRNDVNTKFDKLQTKLTGQAESFEKEQRKKLKELSKAFEVTQVSVEQLKNETDTLIKDGQNCDAYVLMKIETSKLQTLKNKIEEASRTPVKHATFRPMLVQMASFGDLDVQEAPLKPNISLPTDLTQHGQLSRTKKNSGPTAQRGSDTTFTKASTKYDGPATARRLQVGSRVKLTDDYRKRNFYVSSGGGPGTVVEMPSDLSTGCVRVKWDNGNTGFYYMGAYGIYYLELIS